MAMGSRGRMMFDLNELPVEDDEESSLINSSESGKIKGVTEASNDVPEAKHEIMDSSCADREEGECSDAEGPSQLGGVQDVNSGSSSPHQEVNLKDSETGNAEEQSTSIGQTEPEIPAPKEVKNSDLNHGMRCSNNALKRKLDQRKEAMLGKKRSRQIVLINIDEAKLAASTKSSTPRRPPSMSARNRSKLKQ